MLTVWGRTNSINVMKVLWVCDEIGLTYHRIDAGMQFGVVDTADYAAMNPNRRVPVIDDDGFVLWESNTIVRYLAGRHARADLLPDDPRGRADCERWMDWATASLASSMTPLFWQLIRTPADRRDDKVVARAAAETEQFMAILEARLADRRYLCGDHLTVADMPVGAFVHRWLALPVDRPALPALQAYYGRLLERAPYRTHVAHPLS